MQLHAIAWLAAVLLLARAAPSKKHRQADPGRVLFDQRQEGEWNVRADLENFVILIIPAQGAATTPASAGGLGLLDLLSRAVPRRPHPARQRVEATSEQTQAFIESKTAPYHVDITRNQLAKLHPVSVSAEEVVGAKSPSIAFVKNEGRKGRTVVLTVPVEDVVIKAEGKKVMGKLLGAENEQCGPGLERDELGICRIVKQ